MLYKGRLVLPSSSSPILTLLNEFHISSIGGHLVFLLTYKRLSRDVFCRGMKKDIKRFVEECPVCQQNITLALSPAYLLQPLPIPQQVWENISMDFIEGLSKGFDSFLVVVDRLSKYAHFLPPKHPFRVPGVAGLSIKVVVRLHGVPNSIVSD